MKKKRCFFFTQTNLCKKKKCKTYPSLINRLDRVNEELCEWTQPCEWTPSALTTVHQ